MQLLQFIIIIASILFVIFALDAYQRKKLNFLHFVVFVGWTSMLLVFTFNGELLNDFGKFFGLTRWADLIVYISIIMLGYFYFELLNFQTKDNANLSRLICACAISKFDINTISSRLIKSKTSEDKILFLIRVWNEEQVVWEVIDEIVWEWYKKIVLVNDGSTDKTGDIIEEKIKKYNKTTIIHIKHEINRGAWSANKTWFAFLKKYWDKLDIDRIVTYDADWQMDIEDMTSFTRAIQRDKEDNIKIDAYLWSRFVKWGKVTNLPIMRSFILFGSKIVTLLFNKIRVSDPHGGFRVLSLDLIKTVKIESDGMTYASELLDEIKFHGFKFREIPVSIRYTEYSLSKGQKNSNAIKIVLELIYKKLFFK